MLTLLWPAQERVPDSANMFSEVSNYPRHSYRFKSKDELPMHVERTYQPRTNQADGAAMETLVAGTNRHKYFKRPIAPFLQGVPAEVYALTARAARARVFLRSLSVHARERSMLAPVAEAERNPLVPPSEPVLGGKRAVGIQTQFRESEAQTDPYTPDYVVAPGQRPEVLTLATLTAGASPRAIATRAFFYFFFCRPRSRPCLLPGPLCACVPRNPQRTGCPRGWRRWR